MNQLHLSNLRILQQPASIQQKVPSLRGVTVIRTGEGGANRAIAVRIDDLSNDTIGTTNSKENRQQDQANMQEIHDLLQDVALVIVGMVVDPEPAWKTQCQWGEGKTASESKKVVENGYTRCDEEADNGNSSNSSEPGTPMNECVGLEMLRVPEESHEHVLCADMDIQGATHAESNDANSVRNLLDRGSSASKRG